MASIASLAGTAALIGDPSRAAMLVALLSGRALTAGELADAAGIARPTASGHLGQLTDAGLLSLIRQGRHHYFRIADGQVAASLESLMSLSGARITAPKPIRTGPADLALRRARVCYDHLAGEIAVGIADSMVAQRQLQLASDGGALTGEGMAMLASLDMLPEPCGAKGPAFCRPCLDWSERRPHLAGALGRALYRGFLAKGWLRAAATGRAVEVTPLGARELERRFAICPR